jgi:hypothetical protein
MKDEAIRLDLQMVGEPQAYKRMDGENTIIL